MLNKESNAYTLGYAAIMTVVVAVVLTTLFTALKPMHDANEQLAKKKDILKAVGLVDLEDPEKSYEDNIVGYILDHEGNDITDADTSVVPETVDVGKESKLAEDKRKYPIFIYTAEDGGKKYIVPLHGKGLWDKIWGYIAINDDFNTIYGISFDHKAETPGLGAEMKDNPKEYNEPFIGKKLFKGEAFKSEYKGIAMVKGTKREPDHQVSAMSGATITSKGVNEMILEDIPAYFNYFKKIK